MVKLVAKSAVARSLAFCFLAALPACRPSAVHLSGEEAYAPQYAERYSILATDGASSVIEIHNPWQGAEGVASQVFVSRNGELPPEGFSGISVEAPINRAVCFSSTHIAFLQELGAVETVKGVSGADYISDADIRRRYSQGEVRDIGYDTGVNYELLASLRPDIVFIYGVRGENTAITDKFRELHIPFMYIGDYLETTPLGKAEWIVPFGELLDRREEAEKIFRDIALRYDSLRTRAAEFTDRPKVMLNAPYRDVWFVPGDSSYMVSLIRDAGGVYIFAGEDSSVSRPVGGEAAYIAAREADLWLNPNQALTLAELKGQNPKFTDIRCVQQERVYNCTRRRTPEGGSDFWESGALHADRVLRDIILCLHPEAQDETEEGMYYFERLR